MRDQKIIEVVKNYQRVLAEKGYHPEECDIQQAELDKDLILNHVLFMCEKIISHVNAGRYGKANRWLGFQQGVLWSMGIYTIYDLMEHNRPPDSEFCSDM